jgi:lipopolysaccharide exporter
VEDVGKKVTAASVWMLLFKLADRSLGIVSTIILARLLAPGDFGLVAMAMAVVAILELFGNFNFDTFLIRQSGVDRRQYDTAWTFNVLVATCIALLLAAVASAMADFYNEPRLESVIFVLAIAAFVQGFENIGIVAFRKEMQFHKEFRFLLGKKLAGFFVTIPLAFIFRSHWALIAGIVSSRVVGMALSYLTQPYRPRFSLTAPGELFHFSKWLLFNNIANLGRDRSSDFVVGRIAGTQALGLYNISLEIVTMPTTELVAPVNRAAYPMYARLANDLGQLRYTYLQVVSMVALVALPAAVGLGLTAELFVPILLGPKWLDAVPLMQLLAAAGAIGALQSSSWSVFLALGKARTVTLLGLGSLAIMVPMLVVLTRWQGAQGAAIAQLTIMCLLVGVTYALLLRDLQLSLPALLGRFWRPLIGMLAMAAAVMGIEAQWAAADGLVAQMLRLMATIAGGAITYAATILVTWQVAGKPDGGERLLLAKLWPMVRARLPLGQGR